MTRAALVTGAHVTLFDGTIVQAAPPWRDNYGTYICKGCVAYRDTTLCRELQSMCGSEYMPDGAQWVFLPDTPEALAEHVANLISGAYENKP